MFNIFKLFKKHEVKPHKVLIIAVILVSSSVIVVMSSMAYLYSERYYQQNTQELLNDPIVNNELLEQEYEQQIKEIFTELGSSSQPDYKTISQKLMEINVPKDFREQHFKLFIAIEEMAKGDKKNQELVKDQLDWIKVHSSWLNDILSQFIFHNL